MYRAKQVTFFNQPEGGEQLGPRVGVEGVGGDR